MSVDKIYNTKEGFEIPPEHIPSADDMHFLAEGNEKIVGKLIEGLIGFVTEVTQSYISKRDPFKPYTEDLISESLFTLTEFVNSKLGKPLISPMSFTAQVSGAVKNKLNDWVRLNENTIAPPISTQYRQEDRQESKLTKHEIKEYHDITGENEIHESFCYDEFIDRLTEEQELVLRMTMGGGTEYSIAEELGMHRSVVQHNLEEIKHLYEGE